jgi:CMP-N-acetylneuraminic acid synthetase/spore coat polysaccharide biosynthesis predicted glycosyltransferase SpsG
MRILVIIPARGGSKGIPRKNIRLLAGVPLIAHVIRSCSACSCITRTIVSTEDDEIAVIAGRFGAEVLRRPAELSADDTPLSRVLYHAVTELERAGEKYDVVATVQPTSPLIRPETLERAFKEFSAPAVDTVLSVYDNTHLNWTIDEANHPQPLFAQRVNRQFLSKIYTESGGVIASRREVITDRERLGSHPRLVILPPDEAIDIDSYADWWQADRVLNRRRIVFHVVGDRETGLGHVYRALTLARRLTEHEVVFAAAKKSALAIETMRNHLCRVFEYDSDPIPLFEELMPDIVVNDILDTEPAMIAAMKQHGWRVVNFEDQGLGLEQADAVINALYEMSHPAPHVYNGSQYYCLREEFFSATPHPVRDTVGQILICFGGTDPSGLTLKTIRAAAGLPKDIRLQLILGPGFQEREAVEAALKTIPQRSDITCDTRVISYYMENSDLMITSGGRTAYEAAAVGVPAVVMCQNHRELQHLFASRYNGFLNLGLGSEVSDDKLAHELRTLIENPGVRGEMQRRMLAWDGRNGVERVIPIILGTKRV